MINSIKISDYRCIKIKIAGFRNNNWLKTNLKVSFSNKGIKIQKCKL